MTRVDPVRPPVALTIAGSDSGGGAGIQADLKAMTVHDVFGTTIVTATTAQNTRGVHDVHPIPAAHVATQYDAVLDDFEVNAVKTGMLATAEIVETVTERLATFDGPIVVDPVMVAATGDRLLSRTAETAYEALIAEATLVTPNVDEAEVLIGDTIETPADAVAAGRKLVERGAAAALIKGGHLDRGSSDSAGNDDRNADSDADSNTDRDSNTDHDSNTDRDSNPDRTDNAVIDTLVVGPNGGGDDEIDGAVTVTQFRNPHIDTTATHGSGCTLSSAIAARLAHGESLPSAVERAVGGMHEAIRRGYDVGHGPGAVNPTVLPAAGAPAADDEETLDEATPDEGTPDEETPGEATPEERMPDGSDRPAGF